jgi:hypothetical protein
MAEIAPKNEEKTSLFVLQGTFENNEAKYNDKKSTVKFIKKYMSTYSVCIIILPKLQANKL